MNFDQSKSPLQLSIRRISHFRDHNDRFMRPRDDGYTTVDKLSNEELILSWISRCNLLAGAWCTNVGEGTDPADLTAATGVLLQLFPEFDNFHWTCGVLYKFRPVDHS